MEEEIKHLLEENIKLSKENNKLLLKLEKINKWSFVSKIAYYFILVGVAVGAFYFIQPFIDSILSVYSF